MSKSIFLVSIKYQIFNNFFYYFSFFLVLCWFSFENSFWMICKKRRFFFMIFWLSINQLSLNLFRESVYKKWGRIQNNLGFGFDHEFNIKYFLLKLDISDLIRRIFIVHLQSRKKYCYKIHEKTLFSSKKEAVFLSGEIKIRWKKKLCIN